MWFYSVKNFLCYILDNFWVVKHVVLQCEEFSLLYLRYFSHSYHVKLYKFAFYIFLQTNLNVNSK